MAAYTRLDAKDIEAILDIYGYDNLEKVTPLSLGISNSNYRCDLKDGTSVITKVSNDKGISQMKEEQEILSLLSDYPYSLSPILTKEGHSVYQWGQLYGAVFPFIRGSKPMGEKGELFSIGQALAKLHRYSQNKELQNKTIRSHSDVGFDLKGIMNYCEQAQALGEFRSACERLISENEARLWSESQLPNGLIHGDLYIDNTLFLDGELQTLLDFEQAGLGTFIQDIGICVSGSCLDKEGVSLEKIQAFIEGYESVRKLESVEKELLNFSITLGFLDISLWRIKRFYEGDLDPQRKDSYRELLELARSFQEKTKSKQM